jgi:putrescine transport system permease protein
MSAAGSATASAPRRRRHPLRAAPVLPFLWLGLFFLAPFALVAKMALSEAATAQPPYRPVFDLWAGWERFVTDLSALSFANLSTVLGDDLYIGSLWSSLRLAGVATLILLALGYPAAIALARAPERWKPLLLALVILPFWTSFLIRVYAWIGILKPDGYLNGLLMWLGLIREPLQLLDTDFALVLGLVYAYLPFMILPLYAAVERLDRSLIEAARDLGAAPWKTFWLVTLPLTLPGAVAGALLVFIPAVGEIVIPDLLGGSGTLMIGRTLWSEFFSNRDWPLAATLAILLLLALLPPILLYRAIEARRWEGRA